MYNDPKFPEKEYPHQFKVDTKIDEKFNFNFMFSALLYAYINSKLKWGLHRS